jgi:hypothetical protein
MKTLMIKDLSVTEQLDSKAMQAVRGGYGPSQYPSSYYSFSPVYAPTSIKTSATQQSICNNMNIYSENGNNVALAQGITTDISPCVYSQNQNGRGY